MKECKICGGLACWPSLHTREEQNDYVRILEQFKKDIIEEAEYYTGKKNKIHIEDLIMLLEDYTHGGLSISRSTIS